MVDAILSVLVPSSIRRPKLRVVQLRAMGRHGGHLREFKFAEGRSGMPDPDWPDGSLEDEPKVTLNKAERVATMPAELKPQFPMCPPGAGACPPEDLGCAPGYADFLQTISDPEHPEHGDMIAWSGRPFDPNGFTVQ